MVLPRAGSQAGSPAVYLLSKHGSSRGCRSEKTSCDRQLGQMNEKGNGKRANQWDTSAQVSPCALHSSKKHHLAHESILCAGMKMVWESETFAVEKLKATGWRIGQIDILSPIERAGKKMR